MEEKINIAELLKDCPQGMELDCTMYDGLEFDSIDESMSHRPVKCRIKCRDGGYNIHRFSKYGLYDDTPHSKCVIFPKGKTTWEGFHKPFEDGDIIADERGNIAIYKGTMWYNKKLAGGYCGYRKSDNHFIPEPKRDNHFGLIEELHYATEEEKQKLFDTIKANGYKWNAETKTLEKLVEPKFKAGDRIERFGCRYVITEVRDNYYLTKQGVNIRIDNQDVFELVTKNFDIATLKPFDKVLVRDGNNAYWTAANFSHYKEEEYPYFTSASCFKQCIPYEGNEHLLGKTDDCDEYFKIWEK